MTNDSIFRMLPLKYQYSPPQILLCLYAIVIPFQRLFHSSFFIYKFQLPELIAIPLCLATLWHYNHRVKPIWVAYPIILFTIWAILSIGFNYSKPAILEGMGILYLFAIGYVTFKIVSNASIAYAELLLKLFVIGVLLNCIFSLIGLFLFFGGIENDLGIWYPHYPITGSLYRMKGFTSHPIMLSNLALCSLFLSLFLFKKYRIIIIVMLCIGIGLSLTKSILSAIAAFILTYLIHRSRHLRPSGIILGIAFVSILLLKEYTTHFTFPLSNHQVSTLSQAQYWGGDIKIPVTSTHSIYNTLYAQLKQASWEIFLAYPFTGIGGGNTNLYNLEKVKLGQLPPSLSNYDPHSSLFGILAEFGIIGFALIVFAFILTFKMINRLLTENKLLLMPGVLTIFIFIAFESLSADVLNYRHIWLFGGVVYGIYFLKIYSSFIPATDAMENKTHSTSF